jgi:DNA-binding transcriptional LysR family regulator
LTVCDAPLTTLALERRDVDLVVERIVMPLAENHLRAEVLFADSAVVIAASGNPWTRRRRIRLAELMNEPWALPRPDNPALKWAIDAFRAAGLEPPRSAMVTTTGVARIALVAKGRFLSIASESVLKFGGWERSIKILPIDLATKAGAVGIITLENRTLSPVGGARLLLARLFGRWFPGFALRIRSRVLRRLPGRALGFLARRFLLFGVQFLGHRQRRPNQPLAILGRPPTRRGLLAAGRCPKLFR